ncbi:MAG: hypothetical protein ACI9LE_001177 [Paraglaciecola sp.]|jgi:hypothetical protein
MMDNIKTLQNLIIENKMLDFRNSVLLTMALINGTGLTYHINHAYIECDERRH